MVRSPVLPFLRTADLEEGFDVVFADPPYGGDEGTLTLMALSKRAKSLQGCLIVMEHSQGDRVTAPDPIRAIESRRYGGTSVTFFQVIGEGEA